MSTKKRIGSKPTPRPIAQRLRTTFQRLLDHKVIDLAAVRAGKQEAQRLAATMPREPHGVDPAHLLYGQVSNLVSVLAEGLLTLPELDRFTAVIGRAEDEHMPSWPPMSPVSKSHFVTWSMYDLPIGVERETLGTLVLDLGDLLGLDEALLRLLAELQRSRLGLYVHEGSIGATEHIALREIMTGRRYEVACSSGHLGDAGEQWLVRLLPPSIPQLEYHVAFTSPYVIVLPGESEWLAYLRRTLPKTRAPDETRAYERLMKYGLGPRYWLEYIFEGYWEHTDGMIQLVGLPDVAESRPHSKLVDGFTERLRKYYGASLPR